MHATKKWADVVDGWSKQRCSEVRIKVNQDVLAYEASGDKPESRYTPCGASKL